MSYDVDSGVLLYALGVLFGLAALVLFLPDVVFGLSITVRAALLFLAFLAFLVAGFALERDLLDIVAFALSAACYVAFVWYVVSRYDASRTASFLAFAASAALFVGLGYVARERAPTVPTRTAIAVVVGLAAVSGGLVVADAAGGDVTYDVTLEESATVELVERGPEGHVVASDSVPVGTLTATNEFVFTRPADPPDIDGCVVGLEGASENGGEDDRLPAGLRAEHVSVSYDYSELRRNDVISGNAERTVSIETRPRLEADDTGTIELAVERGSTCDVERDEPTLLVLVGEDAYRR